MVWIKKRWVRGFVFVASEFAIRSFLFLFFLAESSLWLQFVSNIQGWVGWIYVFLMCRFPRPSVIGCFRTDIFTLDMPRHMYVAVAYIVFFSCFLLKGTCILFSYPIIDYNILSQFCSLIFILREIALSFFQ